MPDQGGHLPRHRRRGPYRSGLQTGRDSIYRFIGWGMMPLGALAGGWIMALAEPSMGREDGLRLVFLVGAGLFMAIFLYGIARLRLLRAA